MTNNYPTLTALVFLCGLLGNTSSQGTMSNTDEMFNKITNVIDLNSLSISNTSDLNNINSTVINALEETKNLFKQKCDENGGEGAFENAKNGKDNLVQCLKSFVNITKLEADMKRYKPTGDLDLVFKEYCHKVPTLKKCFSNFTAAIEPCLDPKEKENKKVIQNITDSLFNFVCYKEGDRIALFISAGGPECLQSKQQEIQQCINSTFGSYVPQIDASNGSLPGLDSLPSLALGTKECTDISTVQSCVVNELEKCSDPTPANIVDSIFNFILKVTPCQNLMTPKNAASINPVNLLAVVSIVFSLLKFM